LDRLARRRSKAEKKKVSKSHTFAADDATERVAARAGSNACTAAAWHPAMCSCTPTLNAEDASHVSSVLGSTGRHASVGHTGNCHPSKRATASLVACIQGCFEVSPPMRMHAAHNLREVIAATAAECPNLSNPAGSVPPLCAALLPTAMQLAVTARACATLSAWCTPPTLSIISAGSVFAEASGATAFLNTLPSCSAGVNRLDALVPMVGRLSSASMAACRTSKRRQDSASCM
jgi:hypothetical protein